MLDIENNKRKETDDEKSLEFFETTLQLDLSGFSKALESSSDAKESNSSKDKIEGLTVNISNADSSNESGSNSGKSDEKKLNGLELTDNSLDLRERFRNEQEK
jgi:hypothetical protein